ncbi:MAG TPA: rRNA maturation RNase YbeY [Verrucomicrobia bacterium]|nr:rRNA maturation RNase YbeY [Verrucomicrobiota bacterium]
MNLQIYNRQHTQPLDIRAIRRLTGRLFEKAMRREKQMSWGTVTLVLTDDKGIAKVKEATFGYREITDVVTVAYAPMPGFPETDAEIFVNVQRAFTRPCRANWTPAQELALYIAHGCDHLSGADDQTPAERRRMRQRELRWLRSFPSVFRFNKTHDE